MVSVLVLIYIFFYLQEKLHFIKIVDPLTKSYFVTACGKVYYISTGVSIQCAYTYKNSISSVSQRRMDLDMNWPKNTVVNLA